MGTAAVGRSGVRDDEDVDPVASVFRLFQSSSDRDDEEDHGQPPLLSTIMATRLAQAAAEEKRRKRPGGGPSVAGGGGCSAWLSGSAGVLQDMSSSGPSVPPPAATRSACVVVEVEDTMALGCGVCYLPLKPPIFQCNVGHVVCSSCSEKLKNQSRCHVCRGSTGGFRRCHAMETLVESLRVPCPNTAYGCTARTAYYDQQRHRQECRHAPCHCPAQAFCGFIGSMEALVDHLAGVHGWPCSTTVRIDAEMSNICLKDGFNFVRILDGSSSTTSGGDSRQGLFLMNVKRQPLSRAISVLFVHSHAAGDDDQTPCLQEMRCELKYSQRRFVLRADRVVEHDQRSEFIVACTDLSNGLPNPDERFQFLLPNYVLGDDDEKDGIKVGFSTAEW